MDQHAVESTTPDPVARFSIFTENKVGKFSDLARTFLRESIHILALTTLDTTDIGILRIVVDDPDAARELLRSQGLAFLESPILAL